MKALLVVGVISFQPVVAGAQSNGDLKRAAATITEEGVRSRIEVIAHDSMGGRDTPSGGLEKTAEWVAAEFKRLGLRPAGDEGGYLQRFPISVSTVDPDSSFVQFSGPNGEKIQLKVGPDLVVEGNLGPELTEAGLSLVGGPVDPTQIANTDLKGQVVLWIAEWAQGMPSNARATIQALMSRGPRAVIAVVNNDSSFTALGGGSPSPGPTVEVGPPGAPGPRVMMPFFALVTESRLLRDAAEVAPTFAQLRTATAMTVVPVPDWRTSMITKESAPVALSLPNTVGILEGTDPVLKNQYVVFSAHMDHVGSRCGGASPADQICNGADDDASGTVGVVELANAFAQPGARPKRSLIFLGVTGGLAVK